MYHPIDVIPDRIEFDRSRIVELAGVYAVTSGAMRSLLEETAPIAGPVRDGQPLAAEGIVEHGLVSEHLHRSWAEAARDQERLSVDDQLAPDGVISGAIADGERRTNTGGGHFDVPPDFDADPDDPTRGPRRVHQMALDGAARADGEKGRRRHLEPDLLPWQEINDAVATGAAAEIFHEIGGPARINAMSQELRDVHDHIEDVRKQSGPQGPQGPPGAPGPQGPPGPEGPRGRDGRDAQILL